MEFVLPTGSSIAPRSPLDVLQRLMAATKPEDKGRSWLRALCGSPKILGQCVASDEVQSSDYNGGVLQRILLYSASTTIEHYIPIQPYTSRRFIAQRHPFEKRL